MKHYDADTHTFQFVEGGEKFAAEDIVEAAKIVQLHWKPKKPRGLNEDRVRELATQEAKAVLKPVSDTVDNEVSALSRLCERVNVLEDEAGKLREPAIIGEDRVRAIAKEEAVKATDSMTHCGEAPRSDDYIRALALEEVQKFNERLLNEGDVRLLAHEVFRRCVREIIPAIQEKVK